MCTVLMSINKEYVDKILDGTKKYEYRRIRCKRDVSEILIYCTAPVSKVVARVKVKQVLSESPQELWEKTKDYSGVDYEFYSEYFADKNMAYAYELGDVKKFKQCRRLSTYGVKTAPQSYVYID